MSLKTLIFVLVAGMGGYYFWLTHRPAAGGPGSVNGNGFMAMLPLDESTAGAEAVIILAPENCPSAMAQRADSLAYSLSNKGIPFTRASRAGFTFTENPSRVLFDKIDSVMGGEGPVVFVRGRAKANPTLEEVVAEYGAQEK